MNRNVILCLAFLLSIAFRSEALLVGPALKTMDRDQIITNLTRKITNLSNSTNDYQVATLCIALARVHAVTFARNQNSFEVRVEDGLPYFPPTKGWFLPHGKVIAINDEARRHLDLALQYFTKALEHKAGATAKVGVGWCREQMGRKKEAMYAYRAALDMVWSESYWQIIISTYLPRSVQDRLENSSAQKSERELIVDSSGQKWLIESNTVYKLSIPSTTTTTLAYWIADYMLPLLDPQKDAAEIKRIMAIKEAAKPVSNVSRSSGIGSSHRVIGGSSTSGAM